MHSSFALLLALGMQQTAPPAPQTSGDPAQAQTAPSEDIVVSGLRDLEDPTSAVTHETLGSGRTGSGARKSQSVFALADRFAHCAMRDAPANLRLLRETLDGRINSSAQLFAQSQLVRLNVSCVQDPSTVLSSITPHSSVSQAGYDTSYYDRGALFVNALQRFAPNLRLTKQQTADPVVQARFNAREESLARFRLPVDRTYFETAICLVRLQPELSVRLVMAKKVNPQVEAAMVNRARVCVSNAKQVYFDPTQFRFYIADAVYRWAVAARGVDSLIPQG